MEEIKYKISLDDSDFQQKSQNLSMLAQQQANMLGNSYSGLYNGAGGSDFQQNYMMSAQAANMMSSYGGLDPRRVFAEEAYTSSIQRSAQSGISGMYGAPPVMSPYTYSQPYQYPRGFIPGRPDYPEYQGSIAGSTGNMASNFGWNAAFSAVGASGFMGVGSKLDDPIFRQIQSMTEVPMRQAAEGGINAVGGLGKLALFGGQLASSRYLGMGPSMALNPAMYMAGKAIDYTTEGVKDYLDMGEYFRDSMSPYMRSTRLGGGPDYKQIQQFQQDMGKNVAKDTMFTRQDMANIEKLASDQGLFQTNNTVEKASKAIENIGKNLKDLFMVGGKISEVKGLVDNFNSMGVNLGSSTGNTSSFMSQMYLSAFQGSTTVAQMMPGMVQASQMAQTQGLAPMVGGLTHMKSTAMSGEAIRAGAFSQEDLAYYGNASGIAESSTRIMNNLSRSPVGNIMSLSMMNNPSLVGKQSGMGLSGLVGEIPSLGGDPSKYFELQMRMPEMSRMIAEKDSNAFGLGQLNTYVNAVSDTLGGKKLSTGEMYSILTNPNMVGATPQDARAIMKQIENAPNIAQSARESAFNKMRQVELEQLRAPMAVFSKEGMQNLLEKYTEEPIANLAASIQGKMGHGAEWLEDKFIHMTTGKDVIRSKALSADERINKILDLDGTSETTKILNEKKKEEAQKLIDGSGENSVYRGIQQKFREQKNDFSESVNTMANLRKNSASGITNNVSDDKFNEALNDIRVNGFNDKNRQVVMDYVGSRKNNNDVDDANNKVKQVVTETEISPERVIDEARKSERSRSAIVKGFNSDSKETLGDKAADFVYQNTRGNDSGGMFVNQLLSKGSNAVTVQDQLEKYYSSHLGKNQSELTYEEKKQAGAAMRDITRNITQFGSKEEKEQVKVLNDSMVEMNKKSGSLAIGAREEAIKNINDRDSKQYLRGLSSIFGEEFDTETSTSKVEAADKLAKSGSISYLLDKIKNGKDLKDLSVPDTNLLKSIAGSDDVDSETRKAISIFLTKGDSSGLSNTLTNQAQTYEDQAKAVKGVSTDEFNKMKRKARSGKASFRDFRKDSTDSLYDEGSSIFGDRNQFVANKKIKDAAEIDIGSDMVFLSSNASQIFGTTGEDIDALNDLIGNKDRTDDQNMTMFKKMMGSSNKGVSELAEAGNYYLKNSDKMDDKMKKGLRSKLQRAFKTNNMDEDQASQITDSIMQKVTDGKSSEIDDVILNAIKVTSEETLGRGTFTTKGNGKSGYNEEGMDKILEGFEQQSRSFELLNNLFQKLENPNSDMMKKFAQALETSIDTVSKNRPMFVSVSDTNLIDRNSGALKVKSVN